MSFIQGDYKYSLVLSRSNSISGSLTYGQTWNATFNPTPTSEVGDEETYIYLSVMDHDESSVLFIAGTPTSGYCRSVYYNYNGSNRLDMTSYDEDPYETSNISISYSYYNNSGVKAEAVDKTKTTYADIPSTVTNNGVTYTVTSIEGCFSNCSSMTSFPNISNTVINFKSCFVSCSSLSGIFYIPNNTSISAANVVNMFYLTRGNIYLVTNYAVNTTNHTALKNIWQPVASSYNNVYFEADSVPIHIADVVLTRVNDNTGVDDQEGMSVKINCTYQWSTNKLPSNWSISHSVKLTLDTETILTNPTWSTSGTTTTGTIAKYSLGDPLQHIISMEVTQTIKDGSNVTKLIRTASDLETLSSVFAIFDFFPGGRGLAIGSIADSNGLTVSIESKFNAPMKINDESGLFVDTIATSGDDGTINSSLSTLGWSSIISNSYLNLKKSLANLFNFIATTGSDTNTDSGGVVTNWTWRKWPDGTFDMWATKTGTFSQSGVLDDAGKWLTFVAYFNFPNGCKPVNISYMTFVNWGSVNGAQGYKIPCALYSKSTNGFIMYGGRHVLGYGNEYTMTDTEIDIYIHGQWK